MAHTATEQTPHSPAAKGDAGDREEARTSLILLVLRVALMAAAAVAIAWPLTTSLGWMSCGIGAGLGVLLGTYLGRSQLRHWLIVVVALLGFVICLFMAEQFVSWDWVVGLFGGRGALELAEMVQWGGGALLILALLRSSAHRYRFLGVVELVLPLLAAASLFSAHRDGNIHRPQQLVDFALERGQDPTWYLQLLGIVGAFFLAIGLLRLRRGIQILGGIVLIMLLMLGMLLVSANVPSSVLIPKSTPGKGKKKKKQKQGMAAKARGKKQGKQKRKPPKKPPKSKKDKKKHMRFRSWRNKQNRNSVVGIVLFKSDYMPPSKIYYFRQRAMSQYNGVRMVSASRDDVDRDRVGHFPILNNELRVKPPVELPKGVSPPKATTTSAIQAPSLQLPTGKPKNLQQAKERTRQIFRKLLNLLKEEGKKQREQMRLQKVQTIVALVHDHSSPFGLGSPQSYRGLPNPAPRIFLRSYHVDSLAWTGKLYPPYRIDSPKQLPRLLKYFPMRAHDVGESWWPKKVLSYYTKPPDDPRYKALLEKILAPLKDHPGLMSQKLAKAYAIKYWLEHNASYSMQRKPPAGIRDHVSHFLFESRIGYCVHFSHAAVFLFRMIGIPARIAEGYAIPARERGSSSSLLVKVGAAHAWPEIYLRGLGWMPFDLYPKKNLDARRPSPPDPKRRQMLANMARPKKIPPLKKSKDARDKSKRNNRIFGWIAAILAFPWWIFPVGALVLLFLLKWWRRYAYLWTPKARRLTAFYRGFEDRLSEQGVRREAGETLEGFAATLEAMPALQILMGQLSAMHLGSRLISSEPDPAQVKALMQQYRRFFPWYRRLLRIFDPVSWSIHVIHRWRYMPPDWWIAWAARWEQINAALNRILFVFRRAR